MKSGFFISCAKNKEERSFKEFVSKIDALTASGTRRPTYPIRSFEEELKRQILEISRTRKFECFSVYKSMLIVENRTSIAPTEIFRQMRRENTEFASLFRVVPLDYFGKLESLKIDDIAAATGISGTYKIVYEDRLCAPDLKPRVFAKVVSAVAARVSLDTPDFIVIVQAYKDNVGISVIRSELGNFNFHCIA